MSFASRLASVKSPPVQFSTRRTYSILTKSGGGRFFTAAKPPKTITTGSSTTSSNNNPTLKTQDSSPESNPISPNAVKESSPSVDAEAQESSRDGSANTAASSSSSTEASGVEKDTPTQSTSSSATASSNRREQPRTSTTLFAEESSLHHPRPPQDQVLLHSFFSLHRPLLLLPMHAQQPLFNKLSSTGTIFGDVNFSGASPSHQEQDTEEMKGLYDDVDGAVPFEVDMGTGKPLHYQDGQVQYGEEDIPEADADAARLLGRTYVVNRIGSFVDWQNVLKTLGDGQAKKEMDGIRAAANDMVAQVDEAEVGMDSVKRKRRRKMNKHIYKKRRKRERAQRRRLGK